MARVGMLVYRLRVEGSGESLVVRRGRGGVRGSERRSLVVWLEKSRERKTIQQAASRISRQKTRGNPSEAGGCLSTAQGRV